MASKIVGSLLGFFLFWISPGPGYSQGVSLEEVIDKVQEQYEIHQDFKAHFAQETFVKSLGKKQQAEGTVYFKKPGKMRWTYQKPTQQEIISNGKTLWTYRPEDKQVIIGQMSQTFQAKAPSTFLAGIGNLKRDFKGRFEKEPARGKNYFLELTPVETQGSLEKLLLTVDRESFKILQARIQDAMGNITQITFSKIQFDIQLADSLFTFTPPKGVEVFNLPGSRPAGETGK